MVIRRRKTGETVDRDLQEPTSTSILHSILLDQLYKRVFKASDGRGVRGWDMGCIYISLVLHTIKRVLDHSAYI